MIDMVRKQQARCLKRNHQFCIELPKTLEQALALHAKDSTVFWADAIVKQIENVKVAFNILSVRTKASLYDATW